MVPLAAGAVSPLDVRNEFLHDQGRVIPVIHLKCIQCITQYIRMTASGNPYTVLFGIPILRLRAAEGTLKVSIVEPHVTIKALSAAACLFKIAHIDGKSVRNPNLPLVAHDTSGTTASLASFLTNLLPNFC